MKIAVVGSRALLIQNLGDYLPPDTTELVSGGARGVDTCARDYARQHHLRLTEFLPDYARYGRAAPLKRNEQIVDYSDEVLVFWDGRSRGTQHMIESCRQKKKPVTVYTPPLP